VNWNCAEEGKDLGMRVGIDATCWSNPRGYGRFTRNLLDALLAEPQRHQYVLFVDQATYEHCPWPLPAGAEIVVVPTQVAPSAAASAHGSRSLPDLWRMAAAVAKTKLDVFFFPSVYTYFPAPPGLRVLLGVHDVIAETYAKQVFPARLPRLLWNAKGWLGRLQATYIVTVSDYARDRIAEHFRWPADRLWVVGEAPAPVFRPLADRQATEAVLAGQGLDGNARYIMCLGGLNPHKNLPMLLDVLARLHTDPRYADLHLVLVGPAEEDTFTPGAGSLRRRLQELRLEHAVHFTGFIDDEVVVAWLNGALALVMPSLEEGFGLGAVEAAACGAPVIATCNSPLPQLLAGGGYFVDPQRPEQLQTALTALLDDEARRRQLGAAALRQAQALTWGRSAAQFLALLDKLEAA
jgi:glycosyltransferase involved in cell wall biosynthesis